jgi:tetratricopeptide (TPR) repeat protein
MWDAAWLDPATVASARLDLAEARTSQAADDLAQLLLRNPGHHQGRNLAAVAARRLGDLDQARSLVEGTLAANPLDAWARELGTRLGLGRSTTADPTIALDVARELLSVGEDDAAVELLERVGSLPHPPGQTNVAPLALVHRADLELRQGRRAEAEETLTRARRLDRTWCFPSPQDGDALERLRRALPDDARLAELHGHLLYAVGRRDEAIEAWQVAAGTDAGPVVLRNLGVAAHNVQGDPLLAADYYARARALAPDDARLLFESDQLAGRRGLDPAQRIAELLERPDLVQSRDDLSVQLAELLTAAGRPSDALDVLTGRAFQPWEGGEGRVLGAWEEAHLRLARSSLAAGDAATAVAHAQAAIDPPHNLGEARHPLANTADLYLVLGDALAAAHGPDAARPAWERAATQQGDFQGMQVQVHSERTAAAVTALRRLGRTADAQRLRDGLASYVSDQAAVRAQVDYFATSLPDLLLFNEDGEALRRDPLRHTGRDLERDLGGSSGSADAPPDRQFNLALDPGTGW